MSGLVPSPRRLGTQDPHPCKHRPALIPLTWLLIASCKSVPRYYLAYPCRSPGSQGGAESISPTSQLGETQTRRKAVIYPKSPSQQVRGGVGTGSLREMGWSAEHMAYWAGVGGAMGSEMHTAPGIKGPLSLQESDLAVPGARPLGTGFACSPLVQGTTGQGWKMGRDRG